MSDWQQGDVIANGIRLHYHRTGSGAKPPMLLCHGFSDNGLCWTPVARALEDRYDVIMVDARGHGQSECVDACHNPREMADDLAGLIGALGLERPVVMGHSMGAATALQLAANHPTLVGAAILEDAGPRDLPAAFTGPAGVAARLASIEAAKATPIAEMIAQKRLESPTWSEEELGPWALAKQQVCLALVRRGLGAETPWRQVVPLVQCPMLVIYADNALGSSVEPQEAAEAGRLNPLIRAVHVSGAGHNIRREQFAAFMQAVDDFLAAQ